MLRTDGLWSSGVGTRKGRTMKYYEASETINATPDPTWKVLTDAGLKAKAEGGT